MLRKNLLAAIAIFTFGISICKAGSDSASQRMQWFADAKLGVFIHWGIYAVKGVNESWSFHNKKINYASYMDQMKGFDGKDFDADKWASLIAESGAQYSVITTKHHDGVALYPTAFSRLNVTQSTPFNKDAIQLFYQALKKKNIKCGAYFSLLDWSHPDYPGFLKDSSRYKLEKDSVRWSRFLTFCYGQMNEIATRYNPDLWWFDGDWEHSAKEWGAAEIRRMLLEKNSKTILNGRLQGFGDYDTPEQNFPISKPNLKYWELCMTTNDNWGFHFDDHHWKTPYEVISIFADCISMGGNLLLDMGPDAHGNIPAEQVHVLKELGSWNKKHHEAIFSTVAGLPQGHFYGPSTLSKDSMTLYLFVPGKAAGPLVIKGLDNKITSIDVLGTKEKAVAKLVGKISWSKVPGLVYIDYPAAAKDNYMTVLAVHLDKPVKLYRGKGGFD
jgi:alpha-L-fucosidase